MFLIFSDRGCSTTKHMQCAARGCVLQCARLPLGFRDVVEVDGDSNGKSFTDEPTDVSQQEGIQLNER